MEIEVFQDAASGKNMEQVTWQFARDITLQIKSGVEVLNMSDFIRCLKRSIIRKQLKLKCDMSLNFSYLCSNFILKITRILPFGEIIKLCTESYFHCFEFTIVNVTKFSGLVNKSTNSVKITFGDIGGYEEEMMLIQKVIHTFLSSGISDGILIYGDSGCGKTLIGKVLSSEFRNNFCEFHVEEGSSRFKGETERNIVLQFDEAIKKAPCILFIDNFEVLCGSRSDEKEVGTVTTLLHLLDEANSKLRRGVLVIATTASPKSLDPALRRAGRLSIDVELKSPNNEQRKEILHSLSLRYSLDLSDDILEHIANATSGFVGGDLVKLITEAATTSSDGIVAEHNLIEALKLVKPSAIKDTTSAVTGVIRKNYFGYDDLRRKIVHIFYLVLHYRDLFESANISPPTNILLFGPSGCGKTALATYIASYFQLPLIRVSRSTVLGKYLGESEKNLSHVYLQARKCAPCILLFENFEGLAPSKQLCSKDGQDVESRIVNHLKVQLDGVEANDSVFVVAESNRPDLLDQDVIRPGRFHQYLYVGLPSVDDRQKLLSGFLPDMAQNDDLLRYLTLSLDSMTAAEVLSVCDQLQKLYKRLQPKSWREVTRDVASVKHVINTVSSSTSQDMLAGYKKFACIYANKSLI